jgi:hypothetical protein
MPNEPVNNYRRNTEPSGTIPFSTIHVQRYQKVFLENGRSAARLRGGEAGAIGRPRTRSGLAAAGLARARAKVRRRHHQFAVK